ncbi:MAG: hypothetical protein AB1640_01495 [bacterium]
MGFRTRYGNRVGLMLFLLVVLAGCSARKDYQRAVEADTVEAYARFLEEHPGSDERTARAKVRLEELSYEAAVKQDTLAAYADFLGRFPYGRFSQPVQRRAEDLRAAELGVHLYRDLPSDYYSRVSSSALPFRILVLCRDPYDQEKNHLERRWYEDLVRRGLFVPMDPRKTYPFGPDITLQVRQSTLRLCTYPWTGLDADLMVGGKRFRSYQVAGQQPERYLLYEIYRDSDRLRTLLDVPRQTRVAVEARFRRFREDPPLAGSVSLEFEIDQRASHWDQTMITEFVEFLKGLPICRDLSVYPRGQPPRQKSDQRLYLRVDPEFHSPVLRKQWDFVGPSPDWSTWNSAWIVADKDYFFPKMTLDLVDLLRAPQEEPRKGKTAAPAKRRKTSSLIRLSR